MSSDRNYQALQIMFNCWHLSLVEWQRVTIERLKLQLELQCEQISEMYAELWFYREMLGDSEPSEPRDPLELVDLVPTSD